jgi:hypothetical protein
MVPDLYLMPLKLVTMKTVEKRLKAVTMRLVLESFKSLVLSGFFWDFL